MPRWFGWLLLLIGLIVFPNAMENILWSYENAFKFTFEGLFIYNELRDMVRITFAYSGFAMSTLLIFHGIMIIIFHDKRADIEQK